MVTARPLTTHLAILAAAFLMPSLGLIGLSIHQYEVAERTRIEAGTQQVTDDLAGAVERDIATKITMLQTLATSPALDDGPAGPDMTRFDTQARMIARNADVEVGLYDPGGTRRFVATHLPRGAELVTNPVTNEAFHRARDTRDVAVSDLHRGPNLQRHIVTIVVPVIREGEVRYLLSLIMGAESFLELAVREGIATPRFAVLIDRNGLMIARSVRHHDFVGTLAPRYDAMSRVASGAIDALNAEGVASRAFWRTSKSTGWIVAVGVSKEALEAPLWRSLQRIGGLILALVLATGLVVSILARRIATAVSLVTVAAGQFGTRTGVQPLRTNITEVNRIGDALYGACRRLREKSDALLAANRSLEQRVIDRTHELTAARDRAVKAGQVKAEFLANMSHELRTPLTAIIGASELLLLGYADRPEKLKQYLQMQREAGESLLALINDILDFSKIEAGQLEVELLPLSLSDLSRSCTEMLSAQAARKGVSLLAEVSPELPDRVLGDDTRLRQVILNLLSNAVKFTGSGSVRLVIDAVGTDLAPRLRVAVHDTGIGIEGGKIDALFDRFTQADTSTTRRFGGTGLGLAITKRLVGLMGGTIAVESRVGEGSTFAFTLPLLPVEAFPPRLLPSSEARVATSGKRVLLAEDNGVNAEIIRVMLGRLGHEVVVVGDGRSAVLAACLEGPFDVVLMDIQMPELDGYEAACAIRADGCDVPIIALTACALPEEIERCLAAGMDGHIAKPVDWDALFHAVAAPRGEAPERAAA